MEKISSELPCAKSYSDDSIPSINKIRTLLSYPVRRLKGIICNTVSSGIRLGSLGLFKVETHNTNQRRSK
ncbi:MAG TPA: hypothetical protein VFV86_05725 [Nitrososphaeraceae archaeon]|nr:hypothetical protein [Nitrososphaeraceae archaeon]